MAFEIQELINEVYEYDYNGQKPIAIVGPKGGGSKKIRVYSFGGLIAEIPGKECAGSASPILCNPNYFNYLEYAGYEKKKIEEIKDEYSIDANGRRKLFSKQDDRKKYFDIAIRATDYRMKRDNSDNERRVQTNIVRRFLKSENKENGWIVVDMEYNPPKDIIKGRGKKPDLIVYDASCNQFGIIELKYNCESCDNLGDHYKRFKEICESCKKVGDFAKEIKRRCSILFNKENTNFINADMAKRIEGASEDKVWFGFLFVGNKREKAINEIKGIEKTIRGNPFEECYVQYVDHDDNDDYLNYIELQKRGMEPIDRWLIEELG